MKKPGAMLKEVLRSALRKPATVNYPAVKLAMPPRFRGKLKFDAQRCIGCKMCMRDCPTRAISIRKVADKTFQADIDLARCIYCAQCVDSCPKKALDSTPQFELALLDRSAAIETQRGSPAPAPVNPEGTHDRPQVDPARDAAGS